MKKHYYLIALVISFLPITLLAAEPSANSLEKEYQLVIEQYTDKKSQLQQINRQYGNTRKELRELKSEISKLEQNQLKADLNIKKITMFSSNGRDLNDEQKKTLRLAKYEKRKEEVRLRQLKKKYDSGNKSLQEVSIKKNRLQKAVTSLENQKIAIENRSSFQKAKEDKAVKARAAKAAAAKEAARQRWLEKERIRKAALTKMRAAEKAKSAQLKQKPTKKAAPTKSKKITSDEQNNQQREETAKKKYLATRPSPEEALKQQQILLSLSTPLPSDLKALINAKAQALTPTTEEPHLGYSVELKQQSGETIKSLGYFHYLGNQRYIHTLVMTEGFQQYIVGPHKFSKRIPVQFNNKKGTLILNAADPKHPTFELYPASRNEFNHFNF